MPNSESESEWFIYMIRCRGGQLYTGISTDVERRFSEHQAGKGAKFLRGKGPLNLVFSAPAGDRSTALKLELKVKQMVKHEKEALILRGSISR